ncbi:wax ester/triacylglycerol synthase family O-acyltransferase [Planctomycetota bacterium]|nr:wax ester/triacylglycerol synthase family O-acyltransferase [Planctomycetota bacterium]
MKRLSPNDAMFLYGESRETMMHVGSLVPFTPPPDAPPTFLREILEDTRATVRLEPPWNLKLKHPGWLKRPFPAWVEDPTPDIDYHARRSALPSPGGERELGMLVSRLHASPIDFSRPPWETHLIEGLEGGRFALYTKMHHALIDGFTGNKILARSFSTDPTERTRLFFAQGRPKREHTGPRPSPFGVALGAIRGQLGGAGEVAATLRGLVSGFRARDPQLVGRLRAPNSVLNGRIGRNRRFATQQYDLAHVKSLAKASGGTLNDVVLALCAGALRRYLLERNALPSEPLVAMLPVAVRTADDQGGGNAVGAILASLATDVADPRQRLDTIIASTTRGKQRLQGLSKQAVIQLSALTMAPTGVQSMTGTLGRVRPQFNVVISNVPGPQHPLYFRGAYLEAVYPLSIPIHGQALNITCQSYDGKLNFGFTGCRDSLPSMQNLAVYTGEALTELTDVLGTRAV